jgi:hypothetical protein
VIVVAQGVAGRLFSRWLPTALGAAMLVAELPLVSVSASRSADPGQALAALGIGMSVLVVVNVPALALAGLVVVTGGVRLGRYALLVGTIGAGLLVLLAATPLLDGLRALLGIDESLATAVRWCLIGLAPNPIGVALRRHLHGRLIHAHRTRPIMWATLVRIVVSAVLAWIAVSVLPHHGAAAAGLALSAGAFTEFVLLAPVVRRLPSDACRVKVMALVRQHAQLSSAWLLNTLPAMVTTIGIAHSQQPVASLVVWPVSYHLAALFSSPVADWDMIAAGALKRGDGLAAVRRVTLWLVVGLSGLFALVLVTGFDSLYLTRVTEVPAEPARLGLTWLPLLLPMPLLWVLRGAVRGVVVAGDHRVALVVASIAHMFVLAVTVAGLGLTHLPGVAVGAFAIIAGLVAEVVVLAIKAFRRPGAGNTWLRVRDEWVSAGMEDDEELWRLRERARQFRQALAERQRDLDTQAGGAAGEPHDCC